MFISTIMVSYCLIFLNCYIFFPIMILEYFAFKFILKNYIKKHPIVLSFLIFINQGLVLSAGVNLYSLLFSKNGQDAFIKHLITFIVLILITSLLIFIYIKFFAKTDCLLSKIPLRIYLYISLIYLINIIILTLLTSEFLFDYILFFSNL